MPRNAQLKAYESSLKTILQFKRHKRYSRIGKKFFCRAKMAIKLFQFNQKYCKIVGIYLPQANHSRYSLNSINLAMVICSLQFIMALGAFLLFNTKAKGDFGVVFFTLISIIEAIIMYFIFIWELECVLKFIEKCEGFIAKSE